ncbi:MAG: hypothetical protein ACLT8E_10030 [Akkermansia sp.]
MIRMLPGWPTSPGCFVWWKKWSTSACVPGGWRFPQTGWPRVHVEVDYASSAGDWLRIELSLGAVWNQFAGGSLRCSIRSIRS